ncbi:HpcH/HpaI aldolase/citrate lyase family protein [Acuticoccus yangtzensis]|uniref:HpcH/HpaI aldolase/citrate lyase family protein n=1 Tax=Acuticoccus yangtzensis TaxID=1443441 RepID=UPI000949907E|nr:CoA ester lyase [Acuticoccus yangtzensis]
MRSFLFVPGDSEKKLGKAYDSGADVVILDLEDSVSMDRKAAARGLVAEAAANAPGYVAVRVNALDTGIVDEDLSAVMAARPSMIVLPKSETGADVAHLAAKLSVLEAENGIVEGATQVLAIATETAQAMFGLGTYRTSGPRLAAMTWGLEDLSAALGVSRTRNEAGRITDPFALARTLCLAGAKAAGVLPIDSVYTDFRDAEGLAAEAREAAADGFLGKLAIHPAQVAVINEAFTPSAEAVAAARRIVEAFAAAPGAGVVALDGKMVDRPHLVNAQALLARAGEG